MPQFSKLISSITLAAFLGACTVPATTEEAEAHGGSHLTEQEKKVLTGTAVGVGLFALLAIVAIQDFFNALENN